MQGDSMDADDFKSIEEMFKHHVGIMSEVVHHKLDIIVEGHQMLSDKIDRFETRLCGKIDRISGRS
jgi:hypothetical protein